MADKWPLANGNWSNAANWNDGTKPVAGDDVYADGKTIAIDESVTVATIRNTQRTGGTNGGTFNINASVTINANIICTNINSLSCINLNTGTVTINGNLTGGGNSNAYALNIPGASVPGTLTINGNVTGGSAFTLPACIFNNTNATININGNVTGGAGGSNAAGVYNNSNGALNIIGTVSGGTGNSSHGVQNQANATITITGNVFGSTGGSSGTGIANQSTGSVTITGNVTGGSVFSSIGAANNGTATMIITGNCTGGSGSGAHGAINNSTGTLRVYGIAIGNDHGLGYVSNNATVGVSGYGINTGTNQAITTVRGIRYGAKGQSPTSGLVQLDISNLASSSARFRTEPNSFTEYTFGPAENIGGQPAASNVRLGTVYNFGNTTGTCAVPPAASVAYGVPVDNTTGTAVLTEAGLSALFQAALQPNAPIIVERSTNDNKAITFSWPVSGATITGQKSIDNGAYSAVAGAITFLRTESNRHYYALAYNAADRNTVESSIRYKMTDGTYTKYFNLHVVPSGDVEVVVTPLQATAEQMVAGTRIEVPLAYEGTVGPVVVVDASNNPVDITAPCEIIISKKWRGDILVIPNGSITRSGAGNNQFSFSALGATLIPGEHAWALRRLSDKFVFAHGDWIVKQTAKKD